ncbi:MAG: MinD/ParA family protein, partial [Candidatus Hodarchaeota archaeon]
VLSFFTVSDTIIRAIFSVNVASVLARSGFKVLTLDLDFEAPVIPLMLEESSSKDQAKGGPLNQWWLDEIEDSELLEKVLVFQDSTGGELHVLPNCRNIAERRRVLALSEKEHRRGLQKLLKLIQSIKNEAIYDYVIINLQNGTGSLTAGGLFASDFSFLVVDDDSISLRLSADSMQALKAVHPFLGDISGVLLHDFKYATLPTVDEAEIEKIESQFQLPVIARCPPIPDLHAARNRKIEVLPGAMTSQTYLEYFRGLTSSIIGYIQNPVKESIFTTTRLHSLIVAEDSGLPLFTCHFDQRTVKVQTEFTSAALTSFLGAIGMILKDFTDKSDVTRLIEQSHAKVLIEEAGRIRAFLVTSKTSKESRNKLKMFLQAFMKRYEDVLKDWNGNVGAFAKANDLVEQIFGLETVGKY